MALGSRSYNRGYVSSFGMPSGIRALLIANVALFLIYFFSRGSLAGLFSLLILRPADVVTHGMIWQLATHLFIHIDIMSIVWSMLALWMFGISFERTWGTQRFLQFYFFCGVGSGVLIVLASYLFGNPGLPMMTAWAPIYGLLMATAVIAPDTTALFSFLVPMKMKYLVGLVFAIAFLFAFQSGNPVGEMAQLFGGMGLGYLFLRIPKVKGFDPFATVRQSYSAWKVERAKRKFQVYMRKQNSKRDRGIN